MSNRPGQNFSGKRVSYKLENRAYKQVRQRGEGVGIS